MKSRSRLYAALVLSSLIACSSPRDPGGASGGRAPGSGGSMQTGGSSASDGGTPSRAGSPSAGAGGAAQAGDAGATSSAGASGSGGRGAQPEDDLFFVPQGLANTELDDEEGGGLTLIAFTLVQGASGPELYAAVKNAGTTPACDAGMLTYFVDQAEQLVATAASVLQSERLYRLDDDMGPIVPCVAAGEIAMTASTNLPAELVIEELGYLKHSFPAFTVGDLVAIDALTVSEVRAVSTGAESAYAGRVSNGFDQPVSNASVTVYPLNRVGRPLGVATSSAPAEIPAGAVWNFETTGVSNLGVDHVAYVDGRPAAALGNDW